MTDNLITYKSIFVDKSDSYPICRTPKTGAVVRSHRFGKCSNSSADFSTFKYELEQFLSRDYLVSTDARMNTGVFNRPFDLDLAIIHREDNGIRINIEIDAPYAYFSREAKHCIGEDTLRDAYFLDRGWAVLRFSEIQVHEHQGSCLRFLSEFLNAIDPNFQIPPSFLNYSPLKDQDFWGLVEAQKWEKASFRESYMKRELPVLQLPNKDIDKSLSPLEIQEENAVLHGFDGEMEFIQDHRNRHVRDERIQFNSEQHKYFIDGIPVPSVSTLIRKFFPEFDSIGAARKLRPSNPLFGMSVDEIVATWNKKGKEASDKGTFLHEQIENYYLGNEYMTMEEFSLFEDFATSHSFLDPFRCEWRIYDEEFGIAGTIDFVAKNGDKYEMYDWKRSKKVVEPSTGQAIENDRWGKKGIGKLGGIDDTSYNQYCLQQSMYRFILEKNYGVNISKMFLVVIHPDYQRFYKLEVPYLKNYVVYILNTL